MEVVIQDVNSGDCMYNDFLCNPDGTAPTGADLFKKHLQLGYAGLFKIWVTMFNTSTLDPSWYYSP